MDPQEVLRQNAELVRQQTSRHDGQRAIEASISLHAHDLLLSVGATATYLTTQLKAHEIEPDVTLTISSQTSWSSFSRDPMVDDTRTVKGWVLKERKAYKQVVSPPADYSKFANPPSYTTLVPAQGICLLENGRPQAYVGNSPKGRVEERFTEGSDLFINPKKNNFGQDSVFAKFVYVFDLFSPQEAAQIARSFGVTYRDLLSMPENGKEVLRSWKFASEWNQVLAKLAVKHGIA